MEDDIRLVRPEHFEHYRLIRGHFSVLTQMGFSRNRYSMTLVRDPLQTILSTYNFWRTRPEGDPLTQQAKSLSFPDFVRRFAGCPSILHNPYTHHFAALSRDYPEEPDEKELLAAAKHNLAAFDFVGVCEQFEDTVRLLCQAVGWTLPREIPHENRSGRAQLLDSIDDETERALREYNRLDLELYSYAVGLFRARSDAAEPAKTQKPQPAPDNTAAALSARNRFVAFPLPQFPARRACIRQVTAAQEPGARITVTVTYAITEPISQVLVAILIYDAEGNIAYGPVASLDRPALPLPSEDQRQVTFQVAREFEPQTYFVTAALEDARRPGVRYDWMDRAAVFSVAPPPKLESSASKLGRRFARLLFGPFSRPVWARLQAHLQPVEEKLGLLERAMAGVRDRTVELNSTVTRLAEEQRELRQELRRSPRLHSDEQCHEQEAAEESADSDHS